MSQYDLSIDPALVAEAERLVTLEGRAFPTLVIMWESQMLGQDWQTVLVTDYTIPLPPLEPGSSFNEVRIGAYTAEVPTKFLYFGTELTEDAPRVGPEMENVITPARTYQEYRLNAEATSIPYLELINTTPRVYGNGPQDYYSPPIKVERFDAGTGTHLIADNFPETVAGLPPLGSELLTDPRQGFWQGGRFVGTKKMAILNKGEVVGLRRRLSEREVVPPEVVRRDPKIDIRDAWVAIDLGTSASVVALGDGERHQFVPVGLHEPPRLARDFETPSTVAFHNLPRVLKSWRDRVILPLTEWGDLHVGHAAARRLEVQGKERAQRMKATVPSVAALPARFERGDRVLICGRSDVDNTLALDPPADPIVDEEGIDPDDPFDPLELLAYYIGVNVNDRRRGIYLRYAVGMPTGWSLARREAVLVQLRRGLSRSLPAGMVAFDDTDLLQVVDAGPNVLSFAAYAFRVFGITPKPDEPVPFVSIDAGASEVSVTCGTYRVGRPDEVAAGYESLMDHVEPTVLSHVGGDLLLHQLAYKVYAASGTSMRNNDIPFVPPPGEPLLAGAEERLGSSLDGETNAQLLCDVVRPLLENPGPSPIPDLMQLFDREGRVRDVRVTIDRAALSEWLRGRLSETAVQIKEAIDRGFQQVSRGEPPYADLRVLLGGRLGMHAFLHERLEAVLPPQVRIHRFREPDATNVAAPTVKLATALGILALRYQPLARAEVTDDRVGFPFRVGRAKRGKLFSVLDESVGYDVWRELGACTRPDVTVLYTASVDASSELTADDPSIQSVTCGLGYDAVGYRVYLRATDDHHVEVSVGPPGGRPAEDAPRWTIDLASGTGVPASGG
ncbi:MAG: hypothetical protein AAF715_17685 [Myxococcota bacterium]